MVRRDIWVDFNSVNNAGWVETLQEFATPGANLEIGATVVAADDEGTVCEGMVIGNAGGVIRIALDMGAAGTQQSSSPAAIFV